MMSLQRIVLVACGSFNPVTNIHLRMFELARDALNKTNRYEVVAGIISPVCDDYRKDGLINAKHRCKLVELAIETSDWLVLDSWESKQTEWTKTRAVLDCISSRLANLIQGAESPTNKKRKTDREFSSLFDNDSHLLDIIQSNSSKNNLDSDIRVKMLCGGDVLESFAVPGLWSPDDMETIASKYGIVVITRPKSDASTFIYESDLLTLNEENITVVTEWIANDVSATKIRRALRRGDSVKYMLQDSVIDYIYQHSLYDAKPKLRILTNKKSKSNFELDNDSMVMSQSYSSSGFHDDNLMSCSQYSQSSPSLCDQSIQTRLTTIKTFANTSSTNATTNDYSSSDEAASLGDTSSSDLSRLIKLIKECRLCGSQSVRLMIVEKERLDLSASLSEVDLLLRKLELNGDSDVAEVPHEL